MGLAGIISVCKVELHTLHNGPLTKYVKLWVTHAPGMPERFPRHRFKRKPLVSVPGMHLGMCVTHVPSCMSGSLTRGGGENVPGIPGACTIRNFTYLARGPWDNHMPLLLAWIGFDLIIDEWLQVHPFHKVWRNSSMDVCESISNFLPHLTGCMNPYSGWN